MMLIYVAAAWVVGITLAAFLALPTPVWLWLLLIPIGYLVIWWRDSDLRRLHLILLGLLLGALRYQIALPGPTEQALAQFNDQGQISLIGTIAEEPDRRDAYTDLRIDVTKIQRAGEWQETHGRALVQAPRDTSARYGDQVQVDGAPTTPPSAADFSYRDFLARESVFTSVDYARVYILSHDHGNPAWAMLLEFKSAALRAVATLLPEPAASLLSGILLGNDRGIPRALRDAFSGTNTSHIIAISGLNRTQTE
jgi:predicted membrane metal-binding protein